MPAMVILEDWSRHSIEIPAARDLSRNGDRIAYLNAFWVCVGSHREIADRAAKSGWRIRRQRFYVDVSAFGR